MSSELTVVYYKRSSGQKNHVDRQCMIRRLVVFGTLISSSSRAVLMKGSRRHQQNSVFRAAATPAAKAGEYVLEEGIRSIKPYVHEFHAFAKGRWLGREILDVLTREFGSHTPQYWKDAIRNGFVRVNGQKVTEQYKFRNSDAFAHLTHRHEPPVMGSVSLVGETAELLAVCKPPSMPMHPCGAYRYNSLMFVLEKEPLIPQQPTLFLVHRLDRVTSGVVVLAKSKAAAASACKDITQHKTEKTYLARVLGCFPSQERLSQMRLLDASALLDLAQSLEGEGDGDGDGDDAAGAAAGEGQEGSQPRKRPRLSAEAEAGAGAGTETLANPKEADQDPAPAAAAAGAGTAGTGAAAAAAAEAGAGAGLGVAHATAYAPLRRIKPFEELAQDESVGYAWSSGAGGADLGVDEEDKGGDNRGGGGVDSADASSSGHGAGQGAGQGAGRWLLLRAPIRVVSHREGVHCCDPLGKVSLSAFRSLGYCAATNTSLVECRPLTGRTHQLRLHLQLLGCPIANDPCYGGQLFFGDGERRKRAVAAARRLKRLGLAPLSRLPHLEAEEEGQEGQEGQEEEKEETSSSSSSASAPGPESQEEKNQREGESIEAFLIRTCRYCQATAATSEALDADHTHPYTHPHPQHNKPDLRGAGGETGGSKAHELERLLHCDGIWLHAARYRLAAPQAQAQAQGQQQGQTQGQAPGWSFTAPVPEWAKQPGFRTWS